MIELPNEEYIQKDGVTYCTLLQIVKHTIGMDDYNSRHSPYIRHGKKYYRPWRNFFSSFRDDPVWEPLVAEGLAAKHEFETHITSNGLEMTTEGATYWLTRKGLDWLGRHLGITIYDEED